MSELYQCRLYIQLAIIRRVMVKRIERGGHDEVDDGDDEDRC